MRAPRRWALRFLFLAAARPAVALSAGLARGAEASLSSDTPVSKVIELLGLLQRQLEEDGMADQAQHGNYTTWYNSERSDTLRVINQTAQRITSLQTSLEQGEAFREAKQMAMEKAAGEQASAEQELKDASDRRQKERRAFEASEADLSTAADQFERALEVIAKQAPGGAAAAALIDSGLGSDSGVSAAAPRGAASFVAVAKRLRSALEQDHDFVLSGSQREALDGLVRLAADRAVDADTAQAKAADGALDPPQQLDFLQVRTRKGGRSSGRTLAAGAGAGAGPYGDYESQTGGITQTLQSVLDKSQGHLETLRNDEKIARDLFGKLKPQMELEIKNKEQTVTDLKMDISRSQEEAGQLKSQKLAAEQLLKVTEEELGELEADWSAKSSAFEGRTAKRADEKLAVSDALGILSNEKAQVLLAQQAASFLQIGQSAQQRSAVRLLRQTLRQASAPTSGVSLLALKMKTKRSRRRRRAMEAEAEDPFAKVKTMVRSMLRKLQEGQAQDQKHAAWCDSELSKSIKSKEDRESDVQKLKDRMEEMDADLAQQTDEIRNLEEDFREMNNATQAAVELRSGESQTASAALTQYNDAQKLVSNAITVLQKFYSQEEEKTEKADDSSSDSGFKANGMGSGIIGILEVAESDYKQLYDELSLSEKQAVKDFNDLMSEAEVRTAVFHKDLEYKGRAKVKLEGELMRAGKDLKSYEKELEAVLSYLSELKSSCTIKGDSYDERQARREKELASLREALGYLNGEGMA